MCLQYEAVLYTPPALATKEKAKMDYIEKLERMDEHLKRHPHDYQTVIAKMKLASDIYDHQLKRKRDERLKRLAEIKRRLREEDEAHGYKFDE